jgi:hypothetical protein
MLGPSERNILGIADYARSRSAQQSCRDALAIMARLFRLWYRLVAACGTGVAARDPWIGGN